MKFKLKHSSRLYLALGAITLIGLGLRLYNLSPYLFYPDSYENLLAAISLGHHLSPVGTLGPLGISYPDFFDWTRSVYALLILLVSGSGLALATSGQVVSVLTGVASIPVAFFLTRKVFRSELAGLIAATLIAISANLIVWGGFVLTEPTAVFVVLLLTWQVFARREQSLKPLDPGDLLTGALLTLATLTRYEYGLLSIPVVLISYPRFSLKRSLAILGSFAVTLIAAFAILEPFPGGVSEASSEAAQFALKIGTAPFIFFSQDFLLGILGVVGLMLVWRSVKYRHVAIYSSVGLILLIPTYMRVNPDMSRYWTNLIPFLLLPAAYAAIRGIDAIQKLEFKRLAWTLIAVVVLAQAVVSGVGLHLKDSGLWFTKSYEQVLPSRVASLTNPSDVFLVSLPEPYYFYTRRSTISIQATPPYVVTPLPNAQEVVIVIDPGMTTVFPQFASWATSHLESYKIAKIPNSISFRYGTSVISNHGYVTIYKLPYSRLKYLLNQR